jgi:hypothetical protein
LLLFKTNWPWTCYPPVPASQVLGLQVVPLGPVVF